MDAYLSMNFDDFINTNLFDSSYGTLGSVRSEDERSDLLKKWLGLNMKLTDEITKSDLENHHLTLIKYIEKIDTLHKTYYKQFQQSSNNSIERSFSCATFCMLGAYRSVLVYHKLDIEDKMKEQKFY